MEKDIKEMLKKLFLAITIASVFFAIIFLGVRLFTDSLSETDQDNITSIDIDASNDDTTHKEAFETGKESKDYWYSFLNEKYEEEK